ncbi:MAG TPA: type II toxin-antitoxin system mRNA interferase toxin, RelE/StbE family [Candidatus Paceibacterota bacterium]
MIKIVYAPRFVRDLDKLERDLQEEALEKIKSFYNFRNHKQLKVHKLHGPLKNRYSFSINYDYRIVFIFLSKSKAVFLSIGNHDIYK